MPGFRAVNPQDVSAGNDPSGTGGYTARGWPVLADELGLLVDQERLRSHGPCNDTSLLAAPRSLVKLSLTDDEADTIRNLATAGQPGGPEVHRVADLLAGRCCDWATLGLITRAVLPTDPPASGHFRPCR
ncbi:hypothetical protein ACTPOK_09380 [Streptomyces inhibens]|uniref:hypothetical protein n=1 Tax=Streptomyces inhibens TaxID=2293571 RepID=UPI00402AD030